MTTRDYEIGHRKPPVEHRFKPGRSGNPRGRTAPQPEVDSLLNEIMKEFSAVVTITESGKRTQATKLQLLVKSLLKMAIEGKSPALKFLERVTNGFDSKHFGELVPFRMTSTAMKLIEQVERDILEINEERRVAESQRRDD